MDVYREPWDVSSSDFWDGTSQYNLRERKVKNEIPEPVSPESRVRLTPIRVLTGPQEYSNSTPFRSSSVDIHSILEPVESPDHPIFIGHDSPENSLDPRYNSEAIRIRNGVYCVPKSCARFPSN
jgi:hypothetical protein